MSNVSEGFSGWVAAGITTIMAALSSAIAFLFKLRENENAKRLEEMKLESEQRLLELKTSVSSISEKADKCEIEREGLKVQCAVMQSKIETLEVKLERIDVNGTEYSHKRPQK